MVPRTPPGGITLTYPDGSEVGITARQVGTVIRRGTTMPTAPEHVLFRARCACGSGRLVQWVESRNDDDPPVTVHCDCEAAA